IRTAGLTGLSDRMRNRVVGNAFAQPVYRPYREAPQARRYTAGNPREPRQIVRQAYLHILRREPDPSGLRQYTNAMLPEGWSAADVRRSLANSDEYAEKFGGTRWSRGLRYRNGYRYYR